MMVMPMVMDSYTHNYGHYHDGGDGDDADAGDDDILNAGAVICLMQR